ncbi:hypothetical protein LZ480_15805 [Solibacillus sp. MA9]|uniref:Lipoprotein n=1 Tax=Solibacillus palustris TaxID=2908203 RepID=A0ABS9UGS3_9BACL|nr:hypothetical protein [Solibacillus sp. MA9]MCH7323340.1 hypothetical protein [Solibacillus sp. MA9]
MKTFYHSLIMWIPIVLLFSCAAFGVELLEGNKIRTSEYFGLNDFGPFLLFIYTSLLVMLYPISFLPLTFIVSKYGKKPEFKMIIFTLFGGGMGTIVFKIIYDERFIEEFNLSIISSIILFSVAGLLFALVEIAIKRNIKFV